MKVARKERKEREGEKGKESVRLGEVSARMCGREGETGKHKGIVGVEVKGNRD